MTDDSDTIQKIDEDFNCGSVLKGILILSVAPDKPTRVHIYWAINLKWTYFNISNSFTKIYNTLYYTINLYLQ
jgi:hypothetical protein